MLSPLAMTVWMLPVVRLCLCLAIFASIAVPRPVRAQDEFEIQVYDVETAPEGEPGIELHLNQHLIRMEPDATHLTFEPHYGLRDWAELGGYFQTSLTSTGELAYAGAKLRTKLRAPHRLWDDRVGLAINFEISDVPRQFEPNQWGSEIRPIAELRSGPLYAAVNPIVAMDLAGALAGHPQLEPAAKLAYVASDTAMVGIEAYAAFGPVDALGDGSIDRGFITLDVHGRRWDLNVGIGASHGSQDHPIGKLIVGIHP